MLRAKRSGTLYDPRPLRQLKLAVAERTTSLLLTGQGDTAILLQRVMALAKILQFRMILINNCSLEWF